MHQSRKIGVESLQYVRQRSCGMPGRRMHNQPRRLVDRYQARVDVNDVDIRRCADGLLPDGLIRAHCHVIAIANPVTWWGCRSIDRDTACSN